METRANYVSVGFFTLFVILASFAFIYWVAKFDRSITYVPVNVRINGAVTGLAAGGEVHFNGIKVGRVERVVFDADDPRAVYALVEINEDTPVRVDTTATIASQGLTGVAYISLKGGSPRAQSLFDSGVDGKVPLINAQPSAVSDILETVRDVADKANDALGTLKEFIEENRVPVSNIVKNTETFSQALERNADGIDVFLKSAGDVGKSLSALGEKLDGTIKGMEKLVVAVDPQAIKNTVENVESFTGNLRKSGDKIDSMVASVEKVAAELETFSGGLTNTLGKVDKILDAAEAETIKQTIADISETASTAKQVVADARLVTKSFADRRDDIDGILTDAQQMASRLNKSSERVDGVLAKLDGFLGSDSTDSVMSEVKLTLAEFRKVATTMQTRINEIAGGLTQFSNTGLNDVQALVNDARRSVSKIERVITNLESDPKRFLFGNSSVKTYKGRPKR